MLPSSLRPAEITAAPEAEPPHGLRERCLQSGPVALWLAPWVCLLLPAALLQSVGLGARPQQDRPRSRRRARVQRQAGTGGADPSRKSDIDAGVAERVKVRFPVATGLMFRACPFLPVPIHGKARPSEALVVPRLATVVGAHGTDPLEARRGTALDQKIGLEVTDLDQRDRGRQWLIGKVLMNVPRHGDVVDRRRCRLDVEDQMGCLGVAGFRQSPVSVR